jgi:transcriptional regulator with XRE-family HTH domain
LAKSRVKVPKAPPLGPRLQAARKKRRLTLDQLADLSNISKSMLSQIERGQANPTFATLWNIAHALGLKIGSFIADTQPPESGEGGMETMRAHNTPTLQSGDGRCLLRILSPVATASELEWYRIEFDKHGRLESEPHAAGTFEHLTCLKGSVRVESGGGEQLLSKGDTARYKGDVPHLIENVGKSGAIALLVVLYRG